MSYTILFLVVGSSVLGIIFFLVKRFFEDKQKKIHHINPFINTEIEMNGKRIGFWKSMMKVQDFRHLIFVSLYFYVFFGGLGLLVMLMAVMGVQ